MPAFVRNHAVTLLVFAASLVLSWLILARLAAADVDAGDLSVADAGPVIDRVVAADHAVLSLFAARAGLPPLAPINP